MDGFIGEWKSEDASNDSLYINIRGKQELNSLLQLPIFLKVCIHSAPRVPCLVDTCAIQDFDIIIINLMF